MGRELQKRGGFPKGEEIGIGPLRKRGKATYVEGKVEWQTKEVVLGCHTTPRHVSPALSRTEGRESQGSWNKVQGIGRTQKGRNKKGGRIKR